MKSSSTHHAYSLLLAAWTAMCIGFWSVIYGGGSAIRWMMSQYFGLAPADTEGVLELLHHVPPLAAILIWMMGAAMLFILRRWMHAVGDDTPSHEIDFKNDGKDVHV